MAGRSSLQEQLDNITAQVLLLQKQASSIQKQMKEKDHVNSASASEQKKHGKSRVQNVSADMDCWKQAPVKKRRQASVPAASVGAAVATPQTLVEEGLSVPVVESKKMSATPGVCFASADHAKQLVKELEHVSVPLGVVTSKEVCEDSARLQCLVTSGEKTSLADCFLTKVGCSESVVTYSPKVLRVSPKAKTCVAVLQVWQGWMDQKNWSLFQTNPTASFMKWLTETCSIKPLDVFRPTMIAGPDGSRGIRVLVRMSTNALQTVLTNSGKNSVFSRPLFIAESDRAMYKIVWLKDSCLEEALRQAARMRTSVGLVANAKGLGIRVPADSFEECATFALGDEAAQKLTGDLWELTGTPLSWDQDAVAQVLLDQNWAATIVRPFRRGSTRTWIVRFAKDQVPSSNLLQADEEGHLIRVQKATPSVPKAPAKSWTWKRPAVGTSRWSEGPPVVRSAQAVTKNGAPAQAAPTQVDTQSQLSQQGASIQPSAATVGNAAASMDGVAQAILAQLTKLTEQQESFRQKQDALSRHVHSPDKEMRRMKVALDPPEEADNELSDADLESPEAKAARHT